MPEPEGRWLALCERTGLGSGAEAQFEKLAQAHETPPRAYHNLNHIEACLKELDEVRALAEHPNEVELAIWFHDAIFDPKARDNELQSAGLAAEILSALGASSERIENVQVLILATRHDPSIPLDTRDEKLLADIDLAILGKPPEIFDGYERQIREEYSWVPWDVYCEKRGHALKAFHARTRIYFTPEFQDRYDQQARRNLERSIDRLK